MHEGYCSGDTGSCVDGVNDDDDDDNVDDNNDNENDPNY